MVGGEINSTYLIIVVLAISLLFNFYLYKINKDLKKLNEKLNKESNSLENKK